MAGRYCSTECQKAHWQAVHKQACKAAQPFITALEELKIAAPISYENAQQPLTLVGTQVLQSSSLKPLNKEVFTMVTAGNPFCRVCWKTRSDVPTADRNNFRCMSVTGQLYRWCHWLPTLPAMLLSCDAIMFTGTCRCCKMQMLQQDGGSSSFHSIAVYCGCCCILMEVAPVACMLTWMLLQVLSKVHVGLVLQ